MADLATISIGQGWQKKFFRNKPKKNVFFYLNQVFSFFMLISVFVYFFEKELTYAL